MCVCVCLIQEKQKGCSIFDHYSYTKSFNYDILQVFLIQVINFDALKLNY